MERRAGYDALDTDALCTSAGDRMKVRFKITTSLANDVRSNLRRPHPFAYERVGFISAGMSASGSDLLVMAREFRPVEDDEYLNDQTVGAMMGPEAIRKALQWAMSEKAALFHVHSHGGHGRPGFSGIDLRENAKFVPDFLKVAPRFGHGAIVLSDDSAFGQIWLSRTHSAEFFDHFVGVGTPLENWS